MAASEQKVPLEFMAGAGPFRRTHGRELHDGAGLGSRINEVSVSGQQGFRAGRVRCDREEITDVVVLELGDGSCSRPKINRAAEDFRLIQFIGKRLKMAERIKDIALTLIGRLEQFQRAAFLHRNLKGKPISMVMRKGNKTNAGLPELAQAFQLKTPSLGPHDDRERQRHQDHDDDGHQQHLHESEAAQGSARCRKQGAPDRKTETLGLAPAKRWSYGGNPHPASSKPRGRKFVKRAEPVVGASGYDLE